ncbi:hypothetical protein PHMEG_00024097 [Phytophthora megakarya]|uniref:Retrotransposon gag domain-containing protein n=1 Tax=Phytophthora megakarya TaxID=4795 RepID=A0A225VH08_9STRA|nr:hypothetical protein PHMEG_00024097 [Phytophthora megakarya]
MAEVEQERVRWTTEATRTLSAQQEALAAERAILQQLKNTEEHRRSQEAFETQRLQQQFQDLRATVAASLVSDESGDSGSTKSVSGKKSPNRPESRKSSTRKAKENPGSPPSDAGDDSDSSSDDGDNSDSSSSGSEDSLDNDDSSGTAAAKTTKDGTTVWNFRPYINYNAVEKFNDTAPKEDRVNWWERFTDMAAQGSWPDKMKIRQFRSRMPATIRDWYAQLPKSTRHNWKLLSTKFKKLYCRTTGSYAERYFTTKMRSSETALQFFYRLNAAAVKAEIPFQTSSKRRKLHLRRFVKKLKDVQLKTALEGHQFQSISEVERVLRRHEDVWREDGYEMPPTRTRDARADNLPRGGLKPRRPGHAFLTQNVDSGNPPVVEKYVQFQTPEVEEQPRVADPETPEYGPDDYVPSMPEIHVRPSRLKQEH